MSDTIRRIDRMPLVLPKKETLARLGFRPASTELAADAAAHLNLELRRAFDLCRPTGRWTTIEVTGVTDREIRLAGGGVLASEALVRVYGTCREIWLGGATVGPAVAERIAAFTAAGDLRSALIYDALAGETADAAMDFLQQSAGTELRKSGRGLSSRRFSPGYGDWPLAAQQIFFEKLRLNELGMQLTGRFFILPEKSVTALAGVITEAPREF